MDIFLFLFLSDCCGKDFQYYIEKKWWEWASLSCSRFTGKGFKFSRWVLCWLCVCHKQLSLFEICSVYTYFGKSYFLLWMDVKFYLMLFLNLLRCVVLSFLFLIWCFTLIDFCMLNHPCDSWINPAWLWCMTIFMCCWIWFANILLRIFVSIFIKDIGL